MHVICKAYMLTKEYNAFMKCTNFSQRALTLICSQVPLDVKSKACQSKPLRQYYKIYWPVYNYTNLLMMGTTMQDLCQLFPIRAFSDLTRMDRESHGYPKACNISHVIGQVVTLNYLKHKPDKGFDLCATMKGTCILFISLMMTGNGSMRKITVPMKVSTGTISLTWPTLTAICIDAGGMMCPKRRHQCMESLALDDFIGPMKMTY